MRRSRQRGRGVEFDEVRAYAAGDDVRAIDWRVTARSGTPHTKLFHEDREQPILVAVDQRSPMKFGASRCFKSVMAAHVGAWRCGPVCRPASVLVARYWETHSCTTRDPSVANMRYST